MTRLRWLLVGLITLELGIGGYLLFTRLNRPTSPPLDSSLFDDLTAADLRALPANPDSPDELRRVGEVALAYGYYPQAEAAYRLASAQRPGDPDLAFEHGFALERLGLVAEANRRYQDALTHGHSRPAELWYCIGRNALRLDDPAAAREAFDRAGATPAARYERAKLELATGGTPELLEEMERLAVEHPLAGEPVAVLYRVAVARGDTRTRDRLADQIARRSGRLPNRWDSDVAWITGIADGIGLKKRARQVSRDAMTGRYRDAEQSALEVLEAGWDPGMADQLANIAASLGRHRAAVGVLTDAIERDGPWPRLVWDLGLAYERLDQTEQARTTFERAAHLATGPLLKEIRFKLAALDARQGNTPRARQWEALGYLSTGIDHLENGRASDAEAVLQKAVEADPGLVHAWYCLGESHRLRGQTEPARAAYTRCLQLDSNHGRAARAVQLLNS